ncbi:MAG TPA: flagellar protein FlgN [Deltaproteobacteria bacterium]|nr:flagellar protein FlgN [Deltaproteobacteria bacterium]
MTVRELTDHLRREVTLYKELNEALRAETRNLMERDYKGLFDTVSRKESVLLRLSEAASARGRLLAAVARSLGLEGDGVKLSDVIGRLDGAERTELEGLQSSLLALTAGAAEINEVNKLTVKGCLENVNKTLQLLGGLAGPGTYGRTGAVGEIAVKGTRLSEGA